MPLELEVIVPEIQAVEQTWRWIESKDQLPELARVVRVLSAQRNSRLWHIGELMRAVKEFLSEDPVAFADWLETCGCDFGFAQGAAPLDCQRAARRKGGLVRIVWSATLRRPK